MIKKRLRALTGITYPHPDDMPMVRRAGGKHNLTAEQRAKVEARLRRKKAGDWCDDLPPENAEHLIKKIPPRLERVQVEGEVAKILKKDTKFKAHQGGKADITPPVTKED